MPNFGRPDQTGRSSGRRTGRAARAHRPPKYEPWVWQTRELIASPAWRHRNINTIRLLDFLMIEHMNHAGTENGNLKATHQQLRAYGLSANSIRNSIEEAVFLGLIRHVRGGRWAGSNQPSSFRITFLPDRDGNPPTNEWKSVTEEQIGNWKIRRSRWKSATKKRKAALRNESTVLSKERVPGLNIA